jgi:predicted nucleic acid-binding protein
VFLLDTNVISEAVRPRPDARVLHWLSNQRAHDLFISALTIGEIATGVLRLPKGARKQKLERWLEVDVPKHFAGRILPIDTAAARQWAILAAEATKTGRPASSVDLLLLATAAANHLTFVTRNTKETTNRGIAVLNPWE